MGLPIKIDATQRYTYKDYCTWPDNERWEIIHGKAYNMSPAPSTEHQRIRRELSAQLYAFLKGKPCELFFAPFDVRFPENDETDDETETVVQPDIVVVCDKTKLDQRGLREAPDLIIEIISPSTAGIDMKEKFQLYEYHGVKEYWIVFPHEKTVQIYTLAKDGNYGKPSTYVSTDMINGGLLEGLIVDLSVVFS
ncbi:MAG: Uma2 family endonuclease [Candidatus Pacearchaeota archaeon]|nr:Uma2 family endonuclease [Candidatus Pacearchaeota archaeon]